MAPVPRPHRSRWLLLLLAPPVALCAWWLLSRPPESSPAVYEAALDRALEPVLSQHAASAKLGTSSPGQTRRLARELARASVPYLAPADLELWAELRLRVARSSRASCARLWQGADDAFLEWAMAELGSDALDAYSEMLARGLALRLEKKQAPEPPSDAIERAVEEITESLPAAERERFRADATRRDLSAERACQLFLTLSKGAERLEPKLRIDFYRALARSLRQSPQDAAPAPSP